MKVSELKAEGLNKSFKVVITKEDFAKKIDEKLAKVAKGAKIQGFR